MDRNELKAKMIEMLVDNVGREFPNIKESDDLRTDLGLDSVDMVTLLIEVQSQLGVNVPTEEVVNVKTVANLLDLLAEKMTVARVAA